MIKRIAMATSLIVFVLFAAGCTMVKSSVVNQGATQYPAEIKPLIFVNFSTQSDLDYLFHGKVPLRMNGCSIENEQTREVVNFIFEWNPFLAGSKNVPFRVVDHSNTVNTPALITLRPGDYILKTIDITPASAQVFPFTSSDYIAIGLDLAKPTLRFTVPDKAFWSFGTVVIEIKEKKGLDVGDVLQKYKLDLSERHAFLRIMSSSEEEFAESTYPFLRDLNLAPCINLAPYNDHP